MTSVTTSVTTQVKAKASPQAGGHNRVVTGDRARPVLARLLEQTRKGDTLVVVRIDRLARSLSHLLEVIERLEAKGAFFRSIEDPINTASAQGKFTLQVLGAAVEFERALIRERTKAGLASARSEGRIGGNPGRRFTALLLAEVKSQAMLIEKLRHQLACHRSHRFGPSARPGPAPSRDTSQHWMSH